MLDSTYIQTIDRSYIAQKKRIVVKIGSSSLTHKETGAMDYRKIEQLVRILVDIRGAGRDVVLVSSGAIAVGRQTMQKTPQTLSEKQAMAAIGQAKLMMTYQRLFGEYNQTTAQILMTKNTMVNNLSRKLAGNTFEELLSMGVIPVVNENDTISTYEIQFGDNDRLSAIVSALIGADLLILLSDIDGLYTDDPTENPAAQFVPLVPRIDDDLFLMGKNHSSSGKGQGGMQTKLQAAKIATSAGADMIIANAADLSRLYHIMQGDNVGTLFLAHQDDNFDLVRYLNDD